MTKDYSAITDNFIQKIIDKDKENNKYGGRVHTRFPPEPNGYLHIGHAKAILLNYGIARANGGKFNLRFDDTNPTKEEVRFVESIKEDVAWLGADWEDRLFFASDYFERMYECAVELIKRGKAFVCDLSQEQIREYRGTLTESGTESPYRNRSIDENLELFERMRGGEFSDGEKVLRAKIDMASSNINLRDPVIYRIQHATHHRTGDKWCIYPMYDYAHPLSDAFEGITHSLCSLEFEDNRPLYNWFLENLDFSEPPQQIEFARLNLSHTIMSKRKLRRLVEEGYVEDWDDPRMPTICGLRRRGYTPEAIKDFCERSGVAKSHSLISVAQLENCVREDLNKRAPRYMAVLNPLKVIIENYPEGKVEELESEINPEKPEEGKRIVPFSKEIFIERDDFREDPPKKFFRLAPGREIRLKDAYYVKCVDYKKDPETGEISEVRCTYDPETKGGWSEDGRKVRGTAHWVSAIRAEKAEVRLYESLFTEEKPEEAGDFIERVNPNSLTVLKDCLVEPELGRVEPGEKVQFLRKGYFSRDVKEAQKGKLVFNRIVPLRDTWAKLQKKKAK